MNLTQVDLLPEGRADVANTVMRQTNSDQLLETLERVLVNAGDVVVAQVENVKIQTSSKAVSIDHVNEVFLPVQFD